MGAPFQIDHMKDVQAIVVLMTASSHNEAIRIAEHLIESHLAGCVQIIQGMESIYWWEGKIEHGSENLILAKTTEDKFNELEAAVRAIHSYSTPEIIALPVTSISAPYLEWLSLNVTA